ncbi:MAG TPA: VIT domain-containing protein [Bryobacteraceae bacterium]|nr:VIT domain-containing protein [Bryobacteraceae bacterium]
MKLLIAGWLLAAALPAAGQITQGPLFRLDRDGKPAATSPLKHTDVKAEITGFLARVTFTQEFGNPSLEKIEAVYSAWTPDWRSPACGP